MMDRKMAAPIIALGGLLMLGGGPVLAHSYVINRGDTLSEIAQSYQIKTADLAAANNIGNANIIQTGSTLSIPHNVYAVQSGDTLSGIAERFGMGVTELKELNGITNANVIFPGRTLTVSGSGSARSSATSYNNIPPSLAQHSDRMAYIPIFEKWADHYGVPADLMMAIAYQESGWRANADNPHSSAFGIAQVINGTARFISRNLMGLNYTLDRGVDNSIRMQARYLVWLKEYTGKSWDTVALNYYAGPAGVSSSESRTYLARVQALRPSFVKS